MRCHFLFSHLLLIHIPVDGSSALLSAAGLKFRTEIGAVNVYAVWTWAGKCNVHIVMGGCCYE